MRYTIGIDPGVTNGFAVWERNLKRFNQIKDLTYTQLILFAVKLDPATVYCVRVEDPNQNPPVFADKFDTIQVKDPKKRKAAELRIAQNIGANKQGASIIIDLFQALGFVVQAVKPTKTKWDKNQFFQFTKQPGNFSQHGIDAARLCFNF